MGARYGVTTQIGLSASNPVTQRLDFLTESVRMDEEMTYTGGLQGTLARNVARVRQGIRRCKGQVVLQPNSTEWSYILPVMMGSTASGTLYALADSLLSGYYYTVDRGQKVYTYSNIKCSKWRVEARQGEPVKVTLDLVASDETEANSGTFPALSLNQSNAAFMFFDCVLTANSSTYSIKDIDIECDWHLDEDRFFNSQTLSTANNAKDREIKVRFHAPHGDASALYNTGAGGIAVNATFTNGGAILNMDFVKVVFPRKSAEIDGREEVLLPMEGSAYKSSSTLELVTNLTVGP